MFKKNYNIRLELNGQLIHEISSAEISNDIVIGRSSDCTWTVPAEDRSVSGQHARLFLKGKSIFIQDLKSRNGIYFMGEKIQERKIAKGDTYSIGDSKLVIDELAAEAILTKNNLPHHRLEQLTGKNRGKIYQLIENNIKIGASNGCNIIVEDSLVSHVHAMLENHSDGTCWLKDLGSRNGTKVNGTPLSVENAETGRMLKDGDIISIAYLDFRFWDKSVTHIRSHIFLKLGVVALTLALTIGGYFAFQTISPSAKSIRLKAERYAAEERFEQARETLQSAAAARGADTDMTQRLDLLRKLGIWEETVKSWTQIQKLLSGKPADDDIYEANELFSTLVSADRERWQWNADKASKEMKNAQETHDLLSAVLGTEEHLRHDEENIDAAKSLSEKLENSIRICEKTPLSFRKELLIRAEDLVAEIRNLSEEYAEVMNIMSQYKSVADTEKTGSALQALKKRIEERVEVRKKKGLASSRSISLYCKKLLQPLTELQNSKNILMKNYSSVAQMQFDKFSANLHLPSGEQCIISANLSMRRADMEQSNQHLAKIIVQLKNFERIFRQNSIVPGQNSAVLENLFSDTAWNAVFACDCLDKKMPTYSEKNARSTYDKMLGVYAFWEYLRSIGSEFDTTVFEDRFKPELFSSKEIFSDLETFRSFCSAESRIPYSKDIQLLLAEKSGKNMLKQYLSVAETLLEKRKQLVKRLHARYVQNPDSRQGIIAGASALYLSGNSSFKQEELAASLNNSLAGLRRKLAALIDTGKEISPEQLIRNQKELLKTGIPGDPFLKQAWTNYPGGK